MKLLLLPIAAVLLTFALSQNVSAWVCGENGVDPNNCITATSTHTVSTASPTPTNTRTMTPRPTSTAITTHTPTPSASATATLSYTATPIVIIVTATPFPPISTDRQPCPRGTICRPDTGNGGYLKR